MQFCLLYLAGQIDQNQQRLIDYLLEEIKVLREQLGRKPRFTDRQRIRLAAKAKLAGVDTLRKIVPVFTPETLLRWHRRLIVRFFGQYGMNEMRRGNAPTVEVGPYKGQELSVDHIIPRAVCPELDNVIANLELLPLRLNQRKNSDVGQRQRALAEQFYRAGMLSAARLKEINEIAARSKVAQK